jgi:hypothetical protein
MTKRTPWLCLAAGLALAAGAGCADRLHMTPGHGRSSRVAFDKQQANPEAARKPRPLPGLDAQEAGAVAGNYRRSLVAKESQPVDQGLLMLAPPSQPAAPYVPPPSVPQER